MNRLIKNSMVLLCLFWLSSCKKDEPAAPVPPQSGTNPGTTSGTGSSDLVFELVANDQIVQDSTYYTNFAGDTFSIDMFNYYVSNVKLTQTNGVVFFEKESYHLVKHMESANSFRIKDLPQGSYSKIEFLLGVDSTRNVSGIQSGALDPVNNMFWNWHSGYIYFKMEGSYKTLTQPVMDNYAIHIGGFAKPYSCLQTVTLKIDSVLKVGASKIPQVRIKVNAEEVFKNPYPIGFDTYYSNISEETFMKVSENYRDMFTIDKVIN